MKKIILLLTIVLLLCSCTNKKNNERYNELVNELKNVTSSTENIDIDIEVEVEYLKDNLKNYRILINKPDFEMKNITALAITNEEEDMYPSIGIFDDKITLNKDSKNKGIKLSGYFEREDIEFKVYINFTKEGKDYTYYYLADKVTYYE